MVSLKADFTEKNIFIHCLFEALILKLVFAIDREPIAFSGNCLNSLPLWRNLFKRRLLIFFCEKIIWLVHILIIAAKLTQIILYSKG